MNRIAILSDIHFGVDARSTEFAVPGENIKDNCTGDLPIVEGLNEIFLEMKPSHIFIAGDLTSVGEPEEFHFCEEKIISIAQKSGVPIENILCCLGNHDVNWNISAIAENRLKNDIETERYKSISDEVKKCIQEGYQRAAAGVALHNLDAIMCADRNNRGPMPYTGVFEKEEFVVFCLNTGCFCTREQEYSHGKLSADQLVWFDRATTKYKEDSRTKIVLMHHHPFNYSYPVHAADISLLEEGAEFLEIVTKNGINIVIHGHRHHPRVETIQNSAGKPIVYLCAGSLSVNAMYRSNGEIPNMVHFLDVDKDKDYYTLHNYKYTGMEGWKPVIDKKVSPMDELMKVGKIFPEQEREHAIQELKNRKEELIILKWEELDESLQFMKYSEVKELLKRQLKDTHDVIGEFPGEIILRRR